MYLIFYTKSGCHLCEGLLEKLQNIQNIHLESETRDIATREDWDNLYQYEVPVLYCRKGEVEKLIPRPSPRVSVSQLEKLLRQVSEH